MMQKLRPIKNPAKHIRSHWHFNKGVVFVLLFAVIGVGLIIRTYAAATAHLELELSTLAGSAQQVSDAGASGGQAIRFGDAGHGGHIPPSTGCATGPTITSAAICLITATVPGPVVGFSTPRRVQETSYGPQKLDSVAAFRTECSLSHTTKDDPIVYPGQNDAAHWHQFFGNTAVDENMTDPMNQGNSTCIGGTLNRTAYWAPALIDTNSYDPATQRFGLAQPMTPNDSANPGFPPGGLAMQVYYKAGYNGVSSTSIEWFPRGLKIIAGGNPNIAPTGPPSASSPAGIRRVVFDCIAWGHAQSVWGESGVDYDTDRIPARCPAGYYIQGKIIFPQCGARNANGTPVLDSPNHRDHMAYPLGWPDKGCPSSHPIEYPEILEHFRWRVPASGAAGLRFSSDMYPGAAPGWTFHADWWSGWDPTTSQTILNRCYLGGIDGSEPGIDCRLNLTGEPHPNGGWWRLD